MFDKIKELLRTIYKYVVILPSTIAFLMIKSCAQATILFMNTLYGFITSTRISEQFVGGFHGISMVTMIVGVGIWTITGTLPPLALGLIIGYVQVIVVYAILIYAVPALRRMYYYRGRSATNKAKPAANRTTPAFAY